MPRRLSAAADETAAARPRHAPPQRIAVRPARRTSPLSLSGADRHGRKPFCIRAFAGFCAAPPKSRAAGSRHWSAACIARRHWASIEKGDDTGKGDKVRFRIGEVFLPGAAEWHAASDEVEGTITGFSDSGGVERVFALVEVVEKRVLVVPVDKLKLCGGCAT